MRSRRLAACFALFALALLSPAAVPQQPPSALDPPTARGERLLEWRLELEDGEWIEAPSGFVDYSVLHSPRQGRWTRRERQWRAIHAGHVTVVLEPGERFFIEGLELEGRPALLGPDHPELEYGDGTPLRLAARVARAVTLDVVAAESGAPLHGVQVIVESSDGSTSGWVAPPFLRPAVIRHSSLRPESDWPLPGTSVADGLAPLQVEIPRESWVSNQSRETLQIGAPGRVWATVEVDWFVGGKARVELQQSGSLTIRVTGIESLDELARRLAVARPPLSPARTSAPFGGPAATPPPFATLPTLGIAPSSLTVLLLAPLAPDGLDPRELAIELEVDEELEWQASLNEAEIAAFYGDAAPPDAAQLSEHLCRQIGFFDDTPPIVACEIDLDHSNTLHHLPSGRYRLLVDLEGTISSRRALGEVDVEVVAGETATVEVPLELPADGPFVPLVGTIRWPRGSALERFTFWWEPLDGDERRSRNLVGPLEIPAIEHGSIGAAALESWREVRLGTVRPGRWRIHEPDLGLAWELTIAEEPADSRAHRFELIVPDLAEIDVTLIDAAPIDDTNGGRPREPLRLRRALHHSIAGRLPVTSSQSRVTSPFERTPPQGEQRQKLVTVAGAVRFEVEEGWLWSGVYLDQEAHWFEPGRHELTLTVARPTVIDVDWSATETSAVEQRPTESDRELERALRRARLVPLDRDGPPLFADWPRARAGWFRLPSAGRYRLELAVPPGATPLPPRVVEARAGEIVRVTVERPQRG